MPSITDKYTIRAIAREYVSNGHKRADALIEAGYSPVYANSGHCAKIYARKEVIEAIEAYEADIRVDTNYTIEQYQKELDTAIALATRLNQPSACISGIIAKGRSMGLDKDTVTTIDETESIPMDDANQLAIAARTANIQLAKTKQG